jgi:1-acyl-sn-glycerol-3-phosphate acyltransferase
MLGLRAVIFNLLYLLWTVAMHVACLPLLLGPRSWILACGRVWVGVTLWLLRVVVGLDHRVEGAAHRPRGPAIYAVKHQSAWETLFLAPYLGHPAFVLKRELLSIPLFGWYLRKVGMIAVDRGGKASALKKMVRETEATFAAGRSIVIFPEGTRTAPGQHKSYQPGIAALYTQLSVPVVPVALNSGLFWGRKAFLKKPGTITLRILPAIPPGLDRKTFMKRLESAIEDASGALAKL